MQHPSIPTSLKALEDPSLADSKHLFVKRRFSKPGIASKTMVWLLKQTLPLAVLGMLVIIVIYPLLNQEEFSFILSKDRVALSKERLRLEQPDYRGVDQKGRPFAISASQAVQKNSNTPIVELRDIKASLTLDAGIASVEADSGLYYTKEDRIDIFGNIRVQHVDGYQFLTDKAEVDMNQRKVKGTLVVTGQGPLGHFQAKGFELDLITRKVYFTNMKMRIVPTRK